MKKTLSIIAVLALGFFAKAQENNIIVSGGYAFITGEEVYADLTGWRINGVYEFNPMGGPLSHGFAIGYASTSGLSTEAAFQDATIEVGTVPIYYQPKYSFGNSEKVQAFVKGALGWQFANFTRTGGIGGELSSTDSGFMGGGGAGVVFNIKPNFFIQAEYEITWMSNYYYRDGWLNSAMGGIGFRF